MFLYKYIKKNHAESMLRNGTLKIGTLYKYREGEHKAQSDKEEGTKTRITEIKALNKTCRKQSDLPGAYKHFFNFPEGMNLDLTLINSAAHLTEHAPNAYVYCLTQVKDKETMKKFDASRIIKINNVNSFVLAIAKHLKEKGLLQLDQSGNATVYHGSCQYKGRKFDYEENGNYKDHYFLKDVQFSYQHEYRFIFIAKDNTESLQPLIISVPEVTKYIENTE